MEGDDVDHGPSDVALDDRLESSEGPKPESDSMMRPRLTEWIALGVIIGLVVFGSWNWASDVGPPADLSAEDLRTLEMLRTLRDVDVDVELMMTMDSPDRWILDRGFDAPEKDATWTTDTEATLEFRPTSTAARTLHLFVYPFVSETVPSRTLTVETTVDAELDGGGQ